MKWLTEGFITWYKNYMKLSISKTSEFVVYDNVSNMDVFAKTLYIPKHKCLPHGKCGSTDSICSLIAPSILVMVLNNNMYTLDHLVIYCNEFILIILLHICLKFYQYCVWIQSHIDFNIWPKNLISSSLDSLEHFCHTQRISIRADS